METVLAKAIRRAAREAGVGATDCYRFPSELSVQQRTAIGALVQGWSDERAAEHAGVHRVTVTRWRLYDESFRTAYVARMSELWADAAEHIRALVPKAVDTLHSVLEVGDDKARVRAAVEILRLADRLR